MNRTGSDYIIRITMENGFGDPDFVSYFAGLNQDVNDDCYGVGDELWREDRREAMRFYDRAQAEKLVAAWWPNDEDVKVVKLVKR